jgi:hypothetical protein
VESGDEPPPGLRAVLVRPEVVEGAALVLRGEGGPGSERRQHPLDLLQPDGLDDVTLRPELVHGEEARGRAGIAEREHQLVVARARGRELEEGLRVDGRAVLVGAEERDVEVVARVREVVGVAAEERDRLLGGEHEAHVRVLLVAVEPVLGPPVELDHLAPQAGFLQAVLLHVGDEAAALVARLAIAPRARGRLLDPARDVLASHEHVHLVPGARELLAARSRGEAPRDEVLLRARDVLDARVRDVVVREHEAVG